jgi:hypothetical protein
MTNFLKDVLDLLPQRGAKSLVKKYEPLKSIVKKPYERSKSSSFVGGLGEG